MTTDPTDPQDSKAVESQRNPIRVWSVQTLLLAVADALGTRFGAAASVEGELSGFTRAASGHCYFTLKDAHGAAASMRCVMFKRSASLVPFTPRDGMRVQLRGRVAVYEARGELQFVAESMQLAGEGALYEQWLKLKARLQAEGCFDDARKREMPAGVRRVGVVTSLAAAALHDVTIALARRSPHVEVVVYPTPVQGIDAPPAIVAAMALASQRAEVDVLLLVRGGGSLEDLWAFNDERVVRAVMASRMPVVVGVGHESDVTLVDLAADLRAATPTAAAEIAVPAQRDLLAACARSFARMQGAVSRRLEQHASRLDRAAMLAGRPARVLELHRRRLLELQARALPSVRATLQRHDHRLQQLHTRLPAASTLQRQRSRHALKELQTRLHAVDPARVLARGYAFVTTHEGQTVSSVDQLRSQQRVQAVFVDGRASVIVDSVVHDARLAEHRHADDDVN